MSRTCNMVQGNSESWECAAPMALPLQAIATCNPFKQIDLVPSETYLGSSLSFLGSSCPSLLFVNVVSDLCRLTVSFLSPYSQEGCVEGRDTQEKSET